MLNIIKLFISDRPLSFAKNSKEKVTRIIHTVFLLISVIFICSEIIMKLLSLLNPFHPIGSLKAHKRDIHCLSDEMA